MTAYLVILYVAEYLVHFEKIYSFLFTFFNPRSMKKKASNIQLLTIILTVFIIYSYSHAEIQILKTKSQFGYVHDKQFFFYAF